MCTGNDGLWHLHAARCSQRRAWPCLSKSRPRSSEPADRWYALSYGCIDGRRYSQAGRRLGSSAVAATGHVQQAWSARGCPRHQKSRRRRLRQRALEDSSFGRPVPEAQAPQRKATSSPATFVPSNRRKTTFIALWQRSRTCPHPYKMDIITFILRKIVAGLPAHDPRRVAAPYADGSR